MSDSGKKETLSLGSGARPLELRKSGDGGLATRVGKGGTRKTVQVEVRRKRTVSRGSQQKIVQEEVKSVEPKTEPALPQPIEDDKGAIDTKTRHVLKTLTDEERAARERALGNAQKADEAARARAEENARLRAEEENRLASEREASERRRAEEEARKKAEEEARKKAEEEAAKKLREPTTETEIEKPSGNRTQKAEERSERFQQEERKPPTPKARTDQRRRTNRMTVTQALSGDEERQRSLASIRRQSERRRKQQQNGGDLTKTLSKIVRDVVVPEIITVQELANRMAERSVDVVKTLMGMDVLVTADQTIDADTAELVVGEFGHKIRRVSAADVEIGLKGTDDSHSDLEFRPPVVTVMGHVDHGKTSLLDAIRQADVAGGEAGGITQHIGAYQVTAGSGGRLTFIDTPGHEAFTAMRARGARVTDLVILVVAANDGVMPQTVEAINHAKAANVPIIVAVNKMDLADSNSMRVKQELLQHEIVAEEMGGDVQILEVSATSKIGLEELEEAVLLQSEILELKANPNRFAEGVIVEAKLETGRGPVATLLVQRGTLRVGDIFVAGGEWGRVRAMNGSHGEAITEAGPSFPVEVLGLTGTPNAGDDFSVVENEGRAREVSEYRQQVVKDTRAAAGQRGSLEQLFDKIKTESIQELPLVLKGDVQGSVEAIVAAANKLGTEEVRVQVLHAGVGGITESDIELARASNAFIIGFNVRANAQARTSAKKHNTDLRYYSIIYELVDDLKKAMSGLLAPEIRETSIGRADVLEIFSVSKIGKIAGCRIVDGMVRKSCRGRLLRDDIVIHDGPMASLKRHKDDVEEVRAGMECGVGLSNYQDIRAGDQIEFYEVAEIERSL